MRDVLLFSRVLFRENSYVREYSTCYGPATPVAGVGWLGWTVSKAFTLQAWVTTNWSQLISYFSITHITHYYHNMGLLYVETQAWDVDGLGNCSGKHFYGTFYFYPTINVWLGINLTIVSSDQHIFSKLTKAPTKKIRMIEIISNIFWKFLQLFDNILELGDCCLLASLHCLRLQDMTVPLIPVQVLLWTQDFRSRNTG